MLGRNSGTVGVEYEYCNAGIIDVITCHSGITIFCACVLCPIHGYSKLKLKNLKTNLLFKWNPSWILMFMHSYLFKNVTFVKWDADDVLWFQVQHHDHNICPSLQQNVSFRTGRGTFIIMLVIFNFIISRMMKISRSHIKRWLGPENNLSKCGFIFPIDHFPDTCVLDNVKSQQII